MSGIGENWDVKGVIGSIFLNENKFHAEKQSCPHKNNEQFTNKVQNVLRIKHKKFMWKNSCNRKEQSI